MLSGTKTKRAVMAILVAGAVGATGATSASAATVTRTDDTAADFALGTQNNTVVRDADAPAGAVERARTLEQLFDGTGTASAGAVDPTPDALEPPAATRRSPAAR